MLYRQTAGFTIIVSVQDLSIPIQELPQSCSFHSMHNLSTDLSKGIILVFILIFPQVSIF